jgi:hypothetical protein
VYTAELFVITKHAGETCYFKCSFAPLIKVLIVITMYIEVKVKVKVKFALEQTMRTQRGSRGIAVHFL